MFLTTSSTVLACPSRYETKERGEPGTGTMWVQYANGFLSPLVADFSTSGYAGFEGYDTKTLSPILSAPVVSRIKLCEAQYLDSRSCTRNP